MYQIVHYTGVAQMYSISKIQVSVGGQDQMVRPHDL